MGRQCTVCVHKDLDEINRLLLCSDSYRDIARQFGLSKDALARHKESHIPELLLKSQDVKEATEADLLLKKVIEYEGDAKRYRDMAEANGDIELALKAVDRALKCVELCSKVQGFIKDQPTINILVNPQWIALKTTIIAALEPYPDARRAVIDALP